MEVVSEMNYTKSRQLGTGLKYITQVSKNSVSYTIWVLELYTAL